jgi:acetylornithine/succinyldiaminopimelate/putrescine aminotransferase
MCPASLEAGHINVPKTSVRLAPPFVVERDELGWAVDQLAAVLTELAGSRDQAAPIR